MIVGDGCEEHAVAFYSSEFGGFEVCYDDDLFVFEAFYVVVLFDSCYDGSLFVAEVYF